MCGHVDEDLVLHEQVWLLLNQHVHHEKVIGSKQEVPAKRSGRLETGTIAELDSDPVNLVEAFDLDEQVEQTDGQGSQIDGEGEREDHDGANEDSDAPVAPDGVTAHR